MFAIFSPLFLVVMFILVLGGVLFWILRQPRDQALQTPWVETSHNFQIWLLILAAFATGIFIAYLLLTGPIGGG
jgi:uncharacterized Tic20 family protein